MNNIVILGCGYLGYHLAQYFEKQKYDVVVIGKGSYYSKKLAPTIRFVDADLEIIHSYEKYIETNSIVIHAANNINATNVFADIELDIKSNYIPFIQIINLCDSKKIKKFVFLSSAGTVYGNSSSLYNSEDDRLNPVNIYGLQKIYFESLLKIKSMESSHFSYVTLRVSNPYGGDQDPEKKQGIIPILITKAIANQTLELWVDKKTTRDFIYIDDFIQATHKMLVSLECPAETYNIGSGVGTTIGELIEIVEQETGHNINIVYKPSFNTVISTNILCIDKLCKETGYSPEIHIREGIHRTVQSIIKTF